MYPHIFRHIKSDAKKSHKKSQDLYCLLEPKEKNQVIVPIYYTKDVDECIDKCSENIGQIRLGIKILKHASSQKPYTEMMADLEEDRDKLKRML